MTNAIISSIFQVIFFSLIPLIVYLIKKKKLTGFFKYIGLIRSTKKANLLALLVIILLVLPLLLLTFFDNGFREIMTNPKSVAGSIKQMGFGVEAVMTILAMGVLKTALAEEIFFRGFVAKRLIAITNYKAGNWIQAILFGLIHTLLFYNITKNPLFLTLIFVFPTVGAYIKVYLNEKLANGSIIPGWIAHSAANVAAYSFVAFLI